MLSLSNYEQNIKDLGARVCLLLRCRFEDDAVRAALARCLEKWPDLSRTYVRSEGRWALSPPEASLPLEVVEGDGTQAEFEAHSAKLGFGNTRVAHFRYVRRTGSSRSALELYSSHTLVHLRSAFTVLGYALQSLTGVDGAVPSTPREWTRPEQLAPQGAASGLFYSFGRPDTEAFPVLFEPVEDVAQSNTVSRRARLPAASLERVLAALRASGDRFQSLLWISLYLAYHRLRGLPLTEPKHVLLEAPVDYAGKPPLASVSPVDALIGAVALLFVPLDVSPDRTLKEVVSEVSQALVRELKDGCQLRETIAIFTPDHLLQLPAPTILASTINRLPLSGGVVEDVAMHSMYYPLAGERIYSFHAYTLESGDCLLNVNFISPGYPADFMQQWVQEAASIMADFPEQGGRRLSEF